MKTAPRLSLLCAFLLFLAATPARSDALCPSLFWILNGPKLEWSVYPRAEKLGFTEERLRSELLRRLDSAEPLDHLLKMEDGEPTKVLSEDGSFSLGRLELPPGVREAPPSQLRSLLRALLDPAPTAAPKLFAGPSKLETALQYTPRTFDQKLSGGRGILSANSNNDVKMGQLEYTYVPETETLSIDFVNVDPHWRQKGVSEFLVRNTIERLQNVRILAGRLEHTNREVVEESLKKGIPCERALATTPAFKLRQALGFTRVVRAACEGGQFYLDMARP